jgi:hypothetical protein
MILKVCKIIIHIRIRRCLRIIKSWHIGVLRLLIIKSRVILIMIIIGKKMVIIIEVIRVMIFRGDFLLQDIKLNW